MQMSMICCPFKTSFGFYASSLKAEIEKKTGTSMQWVASNCGCGDPIEVGRQFQAKQCDYFNMPMPVEFRSKKAWKRRLRGAARSLITYARAKKYAALSKNAEVVHFQQILNAYGSKAVFHWLHQPSNAIRVITVHELDGDQQEFPETNTTYNLADAVIVHCEDMKQQLVRLKVQENKVHVVLHGTGLPEVLPDSERSGIVFYGGHKLMSGKGVETVFKAMAIIKARMGEATPTLKIHGHYGPVTPKEGAQLALDNGVADKVIWLNQISEEDMVNLYQTSRVCVLPYTGSFAGLPASLAAACKLPVVCTRKAGLPDHLGDSGVWVEENNPEQLAERVIELLTNDALRQQVGAKLLKRAKDSLSWEVIAEKTLDIYQQSTAKKALAKAS
jgi:glycosyltransferase involved in cell wall biosynthesis